MVSRSTKEGAGKKKKIKVLNLNKETVKNLTDDEAKGVKGGSAQCASNVHVSRPGQSLIANTSVNPATGGATYGASCGFQSFNSSGVGR